MLAAFFDRRPLLDKQVLARRFSEAAADYPEHTPLQQSLAAELAAETRRRVGPRGTCRRILEIGCGTGHLTGLLAGAFPGARILAVDLAPGMIEYCRRRVGDGAGKTGRIAPGQISPGRLAFRVADAETMRSRDRFDLIASSATFQWFNHWERTLRRLRRLLRPGGWLAFSLFGERTFAALRALFPPGYAMGQPLPSADRLRRRLRDAGFSRIEIATFPRVRTYPDTMAFFRSLRKIGAGNALRKQYQQPLPGGELAALAARHDRLHASGRGVRITYEVHQVLARR